MKNKLLFFLLVSFLGMSQIWGQTVYTGNFGASTGSTGSYGPNRTITLATKTWNASYSYHSGSEFRLGHNNAAGVVPSKFISNSPQGAALEMLWDEANVSGISLVTNGSFGSPSTWYIFESTNSGSTWSQVATGSYAANGTWSYTTTTPKPSARYAFVVTGSSSPRVIVSTVTITAQSDYYWDTSASSGLGGSATWGTTFTTSTAGNTALVTAPTTAAAVFQGTAGTVTLGASQTVASSTFNVDGYTIATSGSGAKTLAGTVNLTTRNIQFAPISGADLAVSGVISGTGTATSTILTKNGAGTLTLSSSGNTFTGKVLINAGYIATTGESRFGANPGSFTADQITLNGGGISAVSGDITFSSNRGIKLDANGGKFNPSSGRTITLTNVVSGTGGLIKEGAGTVNLSGIHTYTGNTTVSAGTLQLSAANRIANTSNLILNGGTFRTGASTGYAETVGTLDVKANSTIALGTGNHSLVFSNSSGISWDGTALTITGWTGTEGNSGTAGKIVFGSDASGLTAAQLAKITFSGFTNGTMILPTGEIVPAMNTAPYFEIESISGTAFGSICANSTAVADGVFDLYGFNLTSDVTVGPLAGFTFSIDGTTFTNSLTLSPSGGEVVETIRIRFTPTAVQSYNGSVSIAGGGVAVAPSVAVTGTGIANNTPTVSIAITAGTNPECNGGNVVFTATPANTGGATVAYQWKLNGNNVGGNTATYSNALLANDDAVDCTITLTGGSCLTATTNFSNTITMVVHPVPNTPDASQITGDRTGCGSVVLTKSDSDWYWQTSATGTATASLNSDATYTASTSGIVYVRSKNALDCWSEALAIPIVVHTPVSITSNLPTTPRSTCNGGTAFTALSVSATGTGLGYQWYSNTAASTDTATSTAVGTNSNSFTPPSNVQGTLYYYVVVSGTAPCNAVTSNIVEHTVHPVPNTPDALQITGDRTGCGSVVLTKSDSNWYWQTSATGTATDPLNSDTTYTASASGTVYVRAFNGNCWSTALSVPIVVYTPVNITTNLSTTPRSTCNGGTAFTALSVSATGTGLGYQWYSNTAASTDTATSTAVGTNSNSFTPPSNVQGTLYYYVVVSGTAPCTAVTSNIVEHTVHPVPNTPDALQITGDRTGCGSVVLTKSDSNWYWQTSATGTATAPLNSDTTYTASASGTVYVRAFNGNCWSTALAIPIVVHTPVNITSNLSTTPRTTCNGGAAFTALSVSATGTGLSYQWYSNTAASTDTATSTAVGTNSNSFTPPSNAEGTLYYYVVVSGTAPCTAVTSNILEHTVNPVGLITSIAPASGGPVGTVVTITGTGFTPGSTVKFGSVAATDVQIISLTEIQAVVPDGAVSNAIEVSTALSCPAASTFTIINQDASGCN